MYIGQLKSAYAGDYVMSSASVILSTLRHNRVMQLMSQILEDLVQGKSLIDNAVVVSLEFGFKF